MSFRHITDMVIYFILNTAWAAVDHVKPRILGWVLGDHSAETFKPLWKIVDQ